MIPRRVVSLVPSITETLFDLGAGEAVVGITDFCIFPPDLALPRLGGTKNPRVEEIRALGPDLVHMNLEENLRRHGDAIETFAPVFVTEPKSVDDVEVLLGQLGAIHDRRERAAELVLKLRTERRGAAATGASRLPVRSGRIRGCGAAAIRTSPHSSKAPAAGTCSATGCATHSSRLEDVLSLRPDVVFLPDEPYLFTQSDAEEIHGAARDRPISGPSLHVARLADDPGAALSARRSIRCASRLLRAQARIVSSTASSCW